MKTRELVQQAQSDPLEWDREIVMELAEWLLKNEPRPVTKKWVQDVIWLVGSRVKQFAFSARTSARPPALPLWLLPEPDHIQVASWLSRLGATEDLLFVPKDWLLRLQYSIEDANQFAPDSGPVQQIVIHGVWFEAGRE